MPGVAEAEIDLPPIQQLDIYVNSGLPLGNPSLEEEVKRTNHPELKHLLEWSLAINHSINTTLERIPPFKGVMESLEAIRSNSDAIVVSQTPEEALVKEWREQKIDSYIQVIAGQELGKKSDHLRLAAIGKYEPSKILMIGDAPGDHKAAKEVGACFYPINPGREEESWERFHQEAYPKFLNSQYLGEYETDCISEFDSLLPERLPWLSD